MLKKVSNHMYILNILLCKSCLFIVSSCQSLPQMFTSLEDIADDTAIKLEVSREAIAKDTDIDITIKVTNKDSPNAIVKG